MIDRYFQELKEIIRNHTKKEGSQSTAIGALNFFKMSYPSEFLHTMYEPSLCLIVQGAKAVGVGEKMSSYDKDHYLLASVHLPARVQVQEASPSEPHLSLQLVFSMDQMVEILKEMPSFSPKEPLGEHGIYIGENSEALLEPIIRLARLLDKPQDIAMLEPLIMREIVYRLMQDKGGLILRQFVQSGTLAERIAKAIGFIKLYFKEPLKMDDIAKIAGMSSASFYHHFKRITSITPLQFQKSLRLQEAKRLLLLEGYEATHVAFEVGYESPSQFSREYARLFGLPPMKDVRQQQMKAS